MILVGGVAAGLLIAGRKPAAGSATPASGDNVGADAQSATPTQQSTGGENGGATAPSHAGSEAYNGGSETSPLGGAADAPSSPDHWSGPSGPSFTKPAAQIDALGAIRNIGEVTGKAATDSFLSVANSIGGIF